MKLHDFLAQSPLTVAPRLLGAELTRTTSEGTVIAVLTEVEAYCGPQDPGSHTFRSKTARNQVMFGPVGHLYVYFTYGMHWCANIVAHEPEQVGAVLLRAARIVKGQQLVVQRRKKEAFMPKIASGPANLAQSLGLSGDHSGLSLQQASIRLSLSEHPLPYLQSGRVGVSGPGGEPEHYPWRYYLNDPSVSAYRRGK